MQPMAKRSLAWRGLPLLVALLTLGMAVVFIACDEDGPSPIGDHAPDDVDSGGEKPAVDAAHEGGDDDADTDAGEDADAAEPTKDAGKDAGDGGKSKDASDAADG